jgi:hypothetical protein
MLAKLTWMGGEGMAWGQSFKFGKVKYFCTTNDLYRDVAACHTEEGSIELKRCLLAP